MLKHIGKVELVYNVALFVAWFVVMQAPIIAVINYRDLVS